MDFGENKNEAYDHINAKEAMGKRHMTQAGDPEKAAKAFYELAVSKCTSFTWLSWTVADHVWGAARVSWLGSWENGCIHR